MNEFPAPIKTAMRESGAAATCVPVQIDEGVWESALFLHLAGPECKQYRRIVKTATPPLPVALEVELMAHQRAAIVMLRARVSTVQSDPLIFEILLTPGAVTSHYESLKLLSEQERLVWFFGDNDYRVLAAQEQTIAPELHTRFADVAKDAFAHDTVVRMAGNYDAEKAVDEIVSHYTPREGAGDGVQKH